MDPNDREQTELLRNIDNEMKALGQNLGARIDKTNERLESLETRVDTRLAGIDSRLAVLEAHAVGTNERLDQTNARLDKVESTLHELATQQLVLGRYVKNSADRHDGAIVELRERVTRLETAIERKG